MDFARIFKAGLMASTSTLALSAGIGTVAAQPLGGSILGLYGGVGLGWEHNSGGVQIHGLESTDPTDVTFDWKNKLTSGGVVGNLFGGYRVAVAGPWIVGGELRFGFGGSSGHACGSVDLGTVQDCGASRLSATSRFGLNLTAQVGFLLPNGMLPFAKIGYAGKSVKLVGSVPSVGSSVNSSKWLSGIEFGGGIDIPIGIIGGALNMPAFIRADLSYTVFASEKWKSQKYDASSTQFGTVKYGPDTFQAGVSFGLKF